MGNVQQLLKTEEKVDRNTKMLTGKCPKVVLKSRQQVDRNINILKGMLNLFVMITVSNGILSVANVALLISVHGPSHPLQFQFLFCYTLSGFSLSVNFIFPQFNFLFNT